MSSILEITENEYLIKLNRDRFNLSFVRSLLKMVEFSSPADEEERVARVEKAVAATRKQSTPVSDSLDDDDLEIPDRHISPSQNHNSEPDYFDSLDEK